MLATLSFAPCGRSSQELLYDALPISLLFMGQSRPTRRLSIVINCNRDRSEHGHWLRKYSTGGAGGDVLIPLFGVAGSVRSVNESGVPERNNLLEDCPLMILYDVNDHHI
jgi:hypothetical protein